MESLRRDVREGNLHVIVAEPRRRPYPRVLSLASSRALRRALEVMLAVVGAASVALAAAASWEMTSALGSLLHAAAQTRPAATLPGPLRAAGEPPPVGRASMASLHRNGRGRQRLFSIVVQRGGARPRLGLSSS